MVVALNVTAIWTDRRHLDMSLLKSKSGRRRQGGVMHPRSFTRRTCYV
jgi:hypothetical protein